VFVVGLGKDLDPNILRDISGDSHQVYVVPSVQELSTVIRDVISDMESGRGGNSSYLQQNYRLITGGLGGTR
jgi:hypothetical protein